MSIGDRFGRLKPWHATCKLLQTSTSGFPMTSTPLQRPLVFFFVLVGYLALGWLGL